MPLRDILPSSPLVDRRGHVGSNDIQPSSIFQTNPNAMKKQIIRTCFVMVRLHLKGSLLCAKHQELFLQLFDSLGLAEFIGRLFLQVIDIRRLKSLLAIQESLRLPLRRSELCSALLSILSFSRLMMQASTSFF